MTDLPYQKNKNSPVGAIRYWWNLMLFARGFEFEVDAPADRVAQRLAQIEVPEGTVPSLEPRVGEMHVLPDEETQAHNFDLRVARVQMRGAVTTVQAKGRIIYSQGYQTTIVRGHIRLGAIYYAIMLFSILGGLFGIVTGLASGTTSSTLAGLFTLSVTLLIVLQVHSDYRLLMDRIVEDAAGATQDDKDSLPTADVDYSEGVLHQNG